ncbi:MAG: kelch repeat-containing protein, partial [Planctomycetota bacterium]
MIRVLTLILALAGFGVQSLYGADQLPPLPEAVASFGAAVNDGNVYVYGGHVGQTHQHSCENTTGAFWCLDADRAIWQELPSGPALQGLALVAHGESLIRLGGMYATNEPGEAEAMYSTDSVMRFDTLTRRWHDLPSLPSVRSSHDAVTIEDKVYVVGGWGMDSDGDVHWHDQGLVLDLNVDEPTWDRFDQPFERRALSVAVHEGKLYAIGGLTSDDDISNEVNVYDPVTGCWSRAPDLPGGYMNGFGSSCWTQGGRLSVSCFDGKIYQRNSSGTAWDSHWTLAVPRYMHRVLAVERGDDSGVSEGAVALVLGGDSQSGHVRLTEV